MMAYKDLQYIALEIEFADMIPYLKILLQAAWCYR